ncbi:MAG: hypothetical protein GF317_02370, partial [Candidatus Lokiarchaeota archaeon]|nr:hypothetical protein [Candidatus Lokiarchaeota archaeon]
MYLFNGQEQMEIPIKCKLCLNEIKFTVTAEEYKQVTKFPIKKESVHGDPEHILTVFINKNLEIENFKIKQLGEEESAVISQEITESVLKDLGLDDVEIKLYFLTIGRDAVSLGEMALLINKSKEECKQIAEKFMDKGLFKEIVGATPHYSALPPYAALLDQLRDFHDYISKIKNDLPSQVDKSFSEFQTQTGDDTSLAQTGEMIQTLKEKMLTELKTQKESVSPSPSMHDQIQGLSADVEELEDYAKTVMQSQVDEIKRQFENVNTKTSQIIQAQVDDLKDQIENMKSTIS